MSASPAKARTLASLHRRRVDVPVLLAFAAASLYIGLSRPLIHLEKAFVLTNEYSVWTGITGLWDDGEWLLAAVVCFFSFVFPIAKLALLALIWFVACDGAWRARTLKWLEALGRWSMLDVFAVAILIVATKLKPLASVSAEYGVYWFCAAILASMVATILVRRIASRA
jgi:paraquat-inducible protein A